MNSRVLEGTVFFFFFWQTNTDVMDQQGSILPCHIPGDCREEEPEKDDVCIPGMKKMENENTITCQQEEMT